jgi:hypothetical protein
MAAPQFSYWDYVKAAFWKPVQSRILGAMPLTQMLLVSFGLAGFVNPGFWLLGLAGIVAFVGGRSSSERFQKLMDAQRLMARQETAEERLRAAYDKLDGSSQARYRALATQCQEILELAAPGGGKAGVSNFRAGNLNQLLSLFLRLLASRDAVKDTLEHVDQRQLEQGNLVLKERLTAVEDPEGPLARSLKATLEIQEKRLANLKSARNNLAVVEAELERIEQQARLLLEESAVSGRPEALSARLDAVSATLSETSRWMDQHAELFSDIASEELDSGRAPVLPAVLPSQPDESQASEPEKEPPRPPRPRTAQRQR